MGVTSNGDLLDAFENAFPDTGFVLDAEGAVVRTFAGPEIDVLLVEELDSVVGRTVREVFRAQTAVQLERQIERTLSSRTLQTREYVIETGRGARSFEARMAAVETDSDEELVVANFRDITTRDLYAQRLDETNRIVGTIQQSTQAISRAMSVTDLEAAICETITDSTPYQFAWIGRYDREQDDIVPRTPTEGDGRFVSTLDLMVSGVDADADDQPSPAVVAVRSGRPHVIQNIDTMAASAAWQSTAIEEGFHSIGAFPIRQDDDIEGVLTVYAERPYAFGYNERELFADLCRDIAFAATSLSAQAKVRDQKTELEARNAEWEILNRIVRHDIRNKMTVVLAYAELVVEGLSGESREHLEQVIESAEQVVDITKEARSVAEAMASTGELDLKRVDVGAVLQQEIDEIGQLYPNATVVTDGDVPDVSVLANDFLPSVFRNVLSNAVIHNGTQSPSIEIGVATAADTVTITVADDGPGMPDRITETVFEEPQAVADGTEHGVGLFLVASLVDQYGGDIRVSDNDPQGTVVTIELQRA
jgi:signal transduction histidine kinase